MNKNEKVNAIKRLIESGEYECARVVADDWDMSKLLQNMLITRYEAEKILLDGAKKMVELYKDKEDYDMVVFWSNCVAGYQKRIDRMTIAEAEEIL